MKPQYSPSPQPSPQHVTKPAAQKTYPHEPQTHKFQTVRKPSGNKTSVPNPIKLSNRYSPLSQSSNEKPQTNSFHKNKHAAKPQIIINDKPEAAGKINVKTIPGNGTYAKAVSDSRNVAIFSDSMCNRMAKNDLKNKLKCGVSKKALPGATSQDLHTHHMIPTLEQATPDTAIIHCGINDLLQRLDSDEDGVTSDVVSEIASNVIRCGQVCKQHGVNKVCISSIIHKRGTKTQAIINLINNSISRLCASNSFDFLLNKNITYDESDSRNKLFYTDGLHLNDRGKDMLISNFAEYMNID